MLVSQASMSFPSGFGMCPECKSCMGTQSMIHTHLSRCSAVTALQHAVSPTHLASLQWVSTKLPTPRKSEAASVQASSGSPWGLQWRGWPRRQRPSSASPCLCSPPTWWTCAATGCPMTTPSTCTRQAPSAIQFGSWRPCGLYQPRLIQASPTVGVSAQKGGCPAQLPGTCMAWSHTWTPSMGLMASCSALACALAPSSGSCPCVTAPMPALLSASGMTSCRAGSTRTCTCTKQLQLQAGSQPWSKDPTLWSEWLGAEQAELNIWNVPPGAATEAFLNAQQAQLRFLASACLAAAAAAAQLLDAFCTAFLGAPLGCTDLLLIVSFIAAVQDQVGPGAGYIRM